MGVGGLPDHERRSDGETRDRYADLEERMAGVEKRGDSLRRRVRAALALLLAAVVVWAVAYTVAYFNDRQQSKDIAAGVRAIQVERVRNVERQCASQNKRHDDALATLDRVTLGRLTGKTISPAVPAVIVRGQLASAIDALPREQAVQVQGGRMITILLIEALAPRQVCSEIVQQQTGQSTAKTP